MRQQDISTPVQKDSRPAPTAPKSGTAGHPHGWGLPVRAESIPEEIRRGLWCVYKASPRANKPGKYDKIPYGVRGLPVSTRIHAGWITFDEALAAYKRGEWNGIGKLVLPDEGLIYIDVDGDTGAAKWQNLFPTYCERSPSGTGLRLIGRGTTSRDITKPTEIYAGQAPRFLTITGNQVGRPLGVVDIGSPTQAYIDQYAPTASLPVDRTDRPELLDHESVDRSRIPASVAEVLAVGFKVGADRSNELMAVANQLVRAGYGEAEILTLLEESEPVLDVALEHRRDDYDKALDYLWGTIEKAQSYATPTATAADVFQPLVVSQPTPAALPPVGIKSATWGDLSDAEFSKIEWVIFGLLPPGVSILAGRPKQGKSWLVHAICILIAAGRPVFGLFTRKSTVMYLALEDSERRIQLRTRKLIKSHGISDTDIRETFTYATEASRLGEGLEEELVALKTQAPELRLIVIDVLARIRQPRRGSQSVYEADYEVGLRLKKVASLFPDLAILIVHHNNKSGLDALDAISGTYGLTGGMDNTFNLFPGDSGYLELHINGRDIENGESIPLQKGDDGMWTLVSRDVAKESQNSETRNTILHALKGGAESPAEIGEVTGLESGTVTQSLRRMKRQGIIVQAGRGKYRITPAPETEPTPSDAFEVSQ